MANDGMPHIVLSRVCSCDEDRCVELGDCCLDLSRESIHRKSAASFVSSFKCQRWNRNVSQLRAGVN